MLEVVLALAILGTRRTHDNDKSDYGGKNTLFYVILKTEFSPNFLLALETKP